MISSSYLWPCVKAVMWWGERQIRSPILVELFCERRWLLRACRSFSSGPAAVGPEANYLDTCGRAGQSSKDPLYFVTGFDQNFGWTPLLLTLTNSLQQNTKKITFLQRRNFGREAKFLIYTVKTKHLFYIPSSNVEIKAVHPITAQSIWSII